MQTGDQKHFRVAVRGQQFHFVVFDGKVLFDAEVFLELLEHTRPDGFPAALIEEHRASLAELRDAVKGVTYHDGK